MTRAILLASFIAYCLVSPAPAAATPPCGARVDQLAALADQYGESPRYAGVSVNGYLIEILTNEEAGTFTLLLSQPDGKRTCAIDAGEGFAEIEKQALLEL